MFENPRRGRQGRNFTTNVPKILDLKSSSEQILSRKLPLGAPESMSMLTELPGMVTVFEQFFPLEYSDSYTCNIHHY